MDCAELVPVDTIVVGLVFGRDGVWVGETIVKKAGAVVLPGNVSEFAPFECFIVVPAGIDVADFDIPAVAAAAGEGVGKQVAVVAYGRSGYGNSAVGTE